MAEEKLKSIRRFGSRYGRTPKKRFGKIEEIQRSLHKCPFCRNIQVKRLSVGIWQCKKCEMKFTGKAYTISKKKIKTEANENEIIVDDDYDLDEDKEFQGVVPDKGKELKVDEPTDSEEVKEDESDDVDSENINDEETDDNSEDDFENDEDTESNTEDDESEKEN